MEFGDFPSIFDSSTLAKRGLCPVTQVRNANTFTSHSLYYEQHGSGPEQILFIMGLNSSSFAWAAQVPHFGRKKEYTALVFDNRGVGYSDVPAGPFKTSSMAQDVVALLDYVGWTADRSVHVVGISLGGMIAQELADRIPERIASLTLGVTTPGGYPWQNFPPTKGLKSLARATFTSEPSKKIPIVIDMVFSSEWLDEQSIDDPTKTNREVETEALALRFKTTKKQPFLGSIFQMCAGLTHNVSCERLRKISSSIPKVTLITGDADNLVDVKHTHRLKQCMPEAELVQWTKTGHGIHLQRKAEFNALLERTFEEGRDRC